MRDLVGHDRRPSAYIVYLAVAAHAASGGGALSWRALAEMTGLSRRAVQDSVAHLALRKLMAVRRRGPTEPALLAPLSPWRRS
ncbi:MAG: hypothetical protein K2Q06_14625 [Parvularculaceae bacterium]|nr:hypothetical protein [Parvularculaceae bacterium]